MLQKLNAEQRERIRARYEELRTAKAPGNLAAIVAEEFEVSVRTVYRCMSLQGAIEVGPQTEDFENPDMTVRGSSTLYDAQGKQVLKWIKAERDRSTEAMRGIIDDLCENVPTLPTVPYKPEKVSTSDLLTVYPMGDPHFGLYAWDEETESGDFDLGIAERDLCEAMERLVESSPASDNALIINLGDFFEADNMQGETMRSRHKLDTDTRWLKVLRTGIRALIRCIQAALAKHKHVTVICAIGNHDDHSSMFLMTILSHLFEKEERLTIFDAPTIKHYFHWESILIGVHHGHTIKMKELVAQMPYDRPAEFNASKHRYWWTGHIHQDRKIEEQGVLVESARTLAARNAWAASNGYRSGRDAKAVVYHKDFGEIERHTVSVDMLNHARNKTDR